MMKNSATRLMKLNEEEFSSKAWTLGLGSALMIVSGYYVEPAIFLVTKLSDEIQQQGSDSLQLECCELAARVLQLECC